MRTILVAEDEPEVRDYLGLALRCEGYTVDFAENGAEVVDRLSRNRGGYSLLLMDLMMPVKDGITTLREVRQGWPGLPVIMLSGSCMPAHVATVLKGGARDFLAKPVCHQDLRVAVETALGASSEAASAGVMSQVAHQDTWAQRLEFLVERVGGADVPVLLRGETGVGKEVLGRKLHQRSNRAGRPFLKLNCAALPSELVESELFGYERGAFTGAVKTTPGKFEMANGGTILLDEIGDMDFKLQAKLLQVLQDREFLRLGAKETSRVDVRVMAATHCDLEKAVIEGRFREDLFYRLNIVEIHIPPLRERKDEIPGLSNLFLRKYAPGEDVEIPAQLRDVLLAHSWPGNVRELENVIRKYLVFRNVGVIADELRVRAGKIATLRRSANVTAPAPEPPQTETVESPNPPLPALSGRMDTPAFSEAAAASAPTAFILAEVDQARKKAETEAILAALHSTLWNRKQAAALLNIDYKALLYKMKKLGIGEKSPVIADNTPAV